MALTATLYAQTANSMTVQYAGRNSGGGFTYVEMQCCIRKDFQFALAPIYYQLPDANERYVWGVFNQGNTYFFRFREWNPTSGVKGAWTVPFPVYFPITVAQVTAPAAVMQRPAIVVVPEPIDWTVNNYQSVAGHPLENLSTDSPVEQHWMTPQFWSWYPTLSGAPIDTIALLATNVPVGMQWIVWSFLTDADRQAQTNIQYNSGSVTMSASDGIPGRPFYHCIHRLPAPRTEKYWSLIPQSNAGYPAPVLAATYMVMGLARTAKNIAADKVETPMDWSALDRTREGIPDRRCGYHYGRKVDFDISVMTEAQWETQFSDLRHKVGLTDPVLVIPNTRTGAFYHDRILYGPIRASRAQQPFTPRFTHSFSIESLI